MLRLIGWGLLILGVIAATGLARGLAPTSRSVDLVEIVGQIEDRQRADLQSALTHIAADLDDIELVKLHLEQVDWVARVDVTLRWPSKLVVEVEPETPIAYWNDLGFINQHGATFNSPYLTGFDLPHLHGPPDQFDAVMRTYQQVSQMLSAGRIKALYVLERGSVEFELDNGWTILLGSEDLPDRLARALSVIDRLSVMNVRDLGIRIDARYPDGVALNGSLPALDQMWSSNVDPTTRNKL